MSRIHGFVTTTSTEDQIAAERAFIDRMKAFAEKHPGTKEVDRDGRYRVASIETHEQNTAALNQPLPDILGKRVTGFSSHSDLKHFSTYTGVVKRVFTTVTAVSYGKPEALLGAYAEVEVGPSEIITVPISKQFDDMWVIDP